MDKINVLYWMPFEKGNGLTMAAKEQCQEEFQ